MRPESSLRWPTSALRIPNYTLNSEPHSDFLNLTPNSKNSLRILEPHSDFKKLTPKSKSLPTSSPGTEPSFSNCTTEYCSIYISIWRRQTRYAHYNVKFVQQQWRFAVNFVLHAVQNFTKKHKHLNIISSKNRNRMSHSSPPGLMAWVSPRVNAWTQADTRLKI